MIHPYGKKLSFQSFVIQGPMYVAEITTKNIRGAFTSLNIVCIYIYISSIAYFDCREQIFMS